MRVPLLFMLAMIALGAALVSCGDSEEVSVPSAASTSNSPAVTPSPTATSQASAITPGIWHTFSDPCGLFSVSYPAGWFVRPPSTTSCDQVSVILSTFEIDTVGPRFPPGAIKVDIGVAPLDVVSQCEPDANSPTSLAGIAARELVVDYPNRPNNVTRAHAVALEYGGYCYTIGASFAQDTPDEITFQGLLASFKLGK